MKLVLTFTLFAFLTTTVHGQSEIPEDINTLLAKNMCNSCHNLDKILIGPSYHDLAETGNNAKEIAALIAEPQPSNWPEFPPMAPLPFLDKNEVKKIADWIASLDEDK